MRLAISHLTKNFGVITALKDISFEVPSGGFLFLTGPSGAGKSTLIKIILGQIKATSGEVLIGDTNLFTAKKNEIEAVRKKIGVIFQDYQLIPDKTVEENIALNLDIISCPQAEIPLRIDQVLREVGLQSRRFLFPSQLSGGELQRTALARALAINPEIILADEPTGNLDIDNTWNLIKLLKKINRQKDTTIIITTHDQSIIESLSKPTIYLREGQIVKKTNELF